MTVIATDLDRTLLPNGKQEYDGSMPVFAELVETHGFGLIFVTGRNEEESREAITAYGAPRPSYVVAEVGTRIYRVGADGAFTEDTAWLDHVQNVTAGWDTDAFDAALEPVANLRLQEPKRQNRFKRSFYIDDLAGAAAVRDDVARRIGGICPDAEIIYSVDETAGQGLLDVLPRRATKVEGLEFLRAREGYAHDEIIYCGDSGNDVIALTHGFRSVLVRNATDEVRSEVKRTAAEKGVAGTVYYADGSGVLNGYYVSGIIEALVSFGIVAEEEVRSLST